MSTYKHLKFYNKTGDYANFQYDTDSDKWIGRCDMHTISVDLVESYILYIGETVECNNIEVLNFPIGVTYTAYFDVLKPVPEIFTYNITDDQTLVKLYSNDFSLSNISTTLGVNDIKIVNESDVQSKVLNINIGFLPIADLSYTSILYLKDSNDHIFAEIEIYGEGESEDERLRDMLINLGCEILPEDTKIFSNTDILEDDIDWSIINTKRKELLLEYSNIYPYIGSYRALINILKFYGYQNVKVKEYWKNIEIGTPRYGYYKQINIEDLFSQNPNFNTSTLTPSKIYKKSNKFSLTYDITVENGEYDEYGLPLTSELYVFSPEEVLIKMYALKKKLQNYFLPINTKIVDIIGEAVFFAQYKQNVVIEQARIDKISLGINPKVSFSPDKKVIQDLRPFRLLGFPIGKDLNAGGFTYLYTWKIPIDSHIRFTTNYQTVTATFSFNESSPPTIFTNSYEFKINQDNGKFDYTNFEVADILCNYLNDESLNPFTANGFWSYPEVINSNTFIRIVQLERSDIRYITFTFIEEATDNNTASMLFPNDTIDSPFIDVSPGSSFGTTGAAIDTYINTVVGYFNNSAIPVTSLPDVPNVPVGCPILLKNDTFDITWDKAEVSFNQVYVGATTSGHYNWNTIGYYGYHEMQWIVTGPNGFSLDSGRDEIYKLINLTIEAPFIGTYNVELYVWDLYNNMSSSRTNSFDVTMPNANFIAWTCQSSDEFQWDSEKHQHQSDISNESISTELTWDNYTTTWSLPFHENENFDLGNISFNSLDSAEFYKTQINKIDNPLVDRYAYNWNLIGNDAKWEDATNLWWDQMGTKITQFKIYDLTTIGATANIIINENNGTAISSLNFIGLTGSTETKMMQMVDTLNLSTDSLISKFIYYYDTTFNNDHTALIPNITAMSKEYDVHKRHSISGFGISCDPFSYITNYLGYMGDIPSSFEIWKCPTSLVLNPYLIINNNSYLIGSTTLGNLCTELNGATAQQYDGIKDFTFNLVSGLVGSTITDIKIQAIAKTTSYPDVFNISYTGGLAGSLYGRSIINNIDWNTIRVLQYSDEVKLLSTINFCYDNCNIKGKKLPVWVLHKENDSIFTDVRYENPLFSYMFTIKGLYTISLELTDSNGNIKSITKNGFIKVI